MDAENKDVPGPPQPCSSKSSCSSKSTGSKKHNFDSADLARLFKIFTALDEIVKPIDRKKYVMEHKEYYINRQHERLRLTEEIGNVQKWTKGNKEYLVILPNRVWVRDNNPTDKEPEPEMEPPLPFDIKDNLDRPAAIKRIRELFKEMDEILYRKKPQPVVEAPEKKEPEPFPPRNDNSALSRYDSENDISNMLDRTRML